MTSATRTVTHACPVCDGPAHPEFEVRGYAALRCSSCRLLFHDRTAVDTTDLYEEAYFTGVGAADGIGYADYLGDGAWFSRHVWGEIGARAARMAGGVGRMLDMGCASGFLVEAAAEDGWQAAGVDISRFAVDAGRGRGLDLWAGDLTALHIDDAVLDLVTSFHTIEHVPDPVAVLTEARRVIRPTGVLVVEVPNLRSVGALVRRADWAQLRPPEHLSHFRRRSMAALLGRSGWRPERWETPYLSDVAAEAMGGATGSAVHVARRLGVVKALEVAGLGANLRVYARPA